MVPTEEMFDRNYHKSTLENEIVGIRDSEVMVKEFGEPVS
jgi:hypothetical protein